MPWENAPGYVPVHCLKVDCMGKVVKFVTVISSHSVTVDSASCGRSVAAVETSLPGGCLPPRSRLGVGPIIPHHTQIEYCALPQLTWDLGGYCETAGTRGR